MKPLALTLLLVPLASPAQDRPSEADLFGAPAQQEKTPEATSAPAAPAPAPAPAPKPGDRESDLFGAPPSAEPSERTISKEREDPLRLGGQLYLRAQTTGYEDQAAGDWPLTSPNLLDLYNRLPGHMVTDIRPTEAFAEWQVLLNHGGERFCDFPTLTHSQNP